MLFGCYSHKMTKHHRKVIKQHFILKLTKVVLFRSFVNFDIKPYKFDNQYINVIFQISLNTINIKFNNY